MKPLLIYRSLISPDDTVTTELFPGRDKPTAHPLKILTEYSRSQNLTLDKCKLAARLLKIATSGTTNKREVLTEIQTHVARKHIAQNRLADVIAHALYWPDTEDRVKGLPQPLRQSIEVVKQSVV